MTVSRTLLASTRGPKTAGDLLFDKMFYVEMETYSAVDDEQLTVRGEFTSGDAKVDQMMAKRPTRVWRTINEMLELYHDGVSVILVNGIKDVNKIHEIIQQHLSDCEAYHRKLSGSLRREKRENTLERLRDLKSLDEFGRYLYNKARLYTKEVALTGIDKVLADSGDIVGNNIPATDARAIRNSPDYVGIEERMDFNQMKARKRYR